MGVEYEVVKEPWPSRSKRTAVIEGTGQSALPAIELEDGTWYREQSADMAKAIRAGRFSGRLRGVGAATIRASRGYSSVGRAPGSHPGGRRFEPA